MASQADYLMRTTARLTQRRRMPQAASMPTTATPSTVAGSGTGVKFNVVFPVELSLTTDHSDAKKPAFVKLVELNVPLS